MEHFNTSDIPYKVMYQDSGLLEETVRFVAPELADAYDFETAVPLDKEHRAATGRTRLQDKAYLVEPRDPRRPRLLVVLEFQSGNDPKMALRMEEYAHLAATAAADKRKGTAGRLPETLPIVIHNGDRPWRASTVGIVRHVEDGPPTRVPMYATVDLPVLAKGPDKLGRRPQPGGRLETLAGVEAATPRRLPKLLAEAFRRHPGAESSKLREGLHLRVTAMLSHQGIDGELPPLEECERLLAEERGETMRTMMDAQFERWRDKNVARGLARGRVQGRALGMEQGMARGLEQGRSQGLAQGMEQGRAQGRSQGLAQGMEQGRVEGMAQGRVALLARQAKLRFGAGVADRMAALLADVSDTSRLDEAGEWLLKCDSGEALLERLPSIVRGTGNGATG